MKKYILLPVFAFILFSCNKINELTKESPCSNQAYRDSVAVVDKLAILKYAADSSITLDSFANRFILSHYFCWKRFDLSEHQFKSIGELQSIFIERNSVQHYEWYSKTIYVR